MERNTAALSNREYDLVIIGGGIFGVCAAWDACLRGLSVAIIEKSDFAMAASSNHFKMVHGGIRYLQHGDLARIRESSRERSALLRIAPHLVKPLPIVIPTYGYGVKGKPFLGAGLLAYDLLTIDRNRGVRPESMIPRGRFMSRDKVLELFPGLNGHGLSGGAVFHDGQIYNPARLALSFLRSAAEEGAAAANYVEALGFLRKKDRIVGVNARDVLTGDTLEIRAKWVLNSAGPWAHRLLQASLGIELNPCPTFSRDLAFVVKAKIAHPYALAFSTQIHDADSIVDIGGRRLFAVPWRDCTLIGVWHRIFRDIPEKINVTEAEMKQIIHEVNEAYGGLRICLDDVRMVNMGLTLFGGQDRQGNSNLSFGKRSRLIDHGKEHGLDGITTLIGVRATTARGMAEKAVDLILHKIGRQRSASKTESAPICGGDFDCIDALKREAERRAPSGLTPAQLSALLHNYGTEYKAIFKIMDENRTWVRPLGDSTVLEAEVIHAIRAEMAQRLTDIVMRRTDLCSGGYYDESSLRRSAELAANELGWDESRTQMELKQVRELYPGFVKRTAGGEGK